MPFCCPFVRVFVVGGGQVPQACGALRGGFRINEEGAKFRLHGRRHNRTYDLQDVGMSLSLAMNMCPPAWLHAFGSERYDTLLWIARTMSLAL